MPPNEASNYDHKSCEEIHKGVNARLTILQSTLAILITIGLTSGGLMVASYNEASDVASDLRLYNAEKKASDSSMNAMGQKLANDIQLARIDASKELAAAIKIVGYDQRESYAKLMTATEKNSIKLADLTENVESLTRTVNEIKAAQ